MSDQDKFEQWVEGKAEEDAEKMYRKSGSPYTPAVARAIENYVKDLEFKRARNGNMLAIIQKDLVMYVMDPSGFVYSTSREIRRNLKPLSKYTKLGHIDELVR